MSTLSRRAVLQAGGALVISIAVASTLPPAVTDAEAAASALPPLPDPSQLDAWLAVLPDGSVQAFYGKMDMGHGIEVAIAQIVADELDVDLDRVSIVMGDTARTPNQGGASGSTGIATGAKPLRNAAAEARRLLVEAASRELGVPATRLAVSQGVVSVSGEQARAVSYAALIGGRKFNAPVEWNKAVGNFMDVKVTAKPKARSAYRIVGQSLPRRDVEGKVFGTRDFITDLRVPGMLHARMIRPPKAGHVVGSVDVAALTAKYPQVQVVREKDFVAVVAPREWTAVKAARDLKISWMRDTAQPAWPGHDGLHAWIRKAPVIKRDEPLKKGDVDAAFRTAARIVEAEYEWPLQSHACIGPACAVADVRADRATVWTGSQKPHSVRDGMAKLLGLPVDAVHAIWVMGPGSYGRNDAGDAAMDAAWLSKRLGKPVRVQGMRHDGTAWDPKGPACVLRSRAALDAQGNVLAWDFLARGLSRTDVSFNEADPRDTLAGQALGLALSPAPNFGIPSESYGFASKRHAWEAVAPLQTRYSPLRTSHLRDPVGPEVHFGSEQAIDELAHAVGQDPVAFRLKHLADPRDLAVVKAAADRCGWAPRMKSPVRAAGKSAVLTGRGIAFASRAGTVVAVVVEVEVTPATGRVWAKRVTVAHDCGLVVNPRGLVQTIEGNVMHGLSRTLFEEVQFDADTVRSVDWASYPILDIQDAPESVDVVLLDSAQGESTGAGEPTIRVVPAALANAIFDATGVRLRRAPFTPAHVKAALQSRTRKA
ncbi:MAG: Nicotinate dehydrogenase subunit [Pseudomonadota bacterium]|jgi:CO/xanthine dehydrogenase Mo-binding subunit